MATSPDEIRRYEARLEAIEKTLVDHFNESGFQPEFRDETWHVNLFGYNLELTRISAFINEAIEELSDNDTSKT